MQDFESVFMVENTQFKYSPTYILIEKSPLNPRDLLLKQEHKHYVI